MSPPQRPSARLAALQHRDFRLLWYGQLISTTGSQMQLIAVNWQVYELLKGTSTTLTLWGHALHLNAGALGLGGLGLARVLPILFFAMVGGVLADTYSRRRLLILTQCASALLSALLAALTFSGHATVTTIYLLTAALSAVLALDGPARESLVPNVVPRAHLTNAVSLNMLLRVLGTIIGPALAGLMVAYTTIGLVYSVNALSFLAALITLVMMHYRGGVAVKRTAAGWRALVEGIRFTYGSRMIWSTMLLDFFATFFSSARTMLPIVADQVLHVGPSGYGLLATAQPVGAVLAGAITSLRREIHRQGVCVVGQCSPLWFSHRLVWACGRLCAFLCPVCPYRRRGHSIQRHPRHHSPAVDAGPSARAHGRRQHHLFYGRPATGRTGSRSGRVAVRRAFGHLHGRCGDCLAHGLGGLALSAPAPLHQ